MTASDGQAPRRTSRFVIAVLLAGLAALGLSSLYRIDAVGSLDVELAEWVATEMPTWAEWLFRPFHWLGGWMGMTPISVGLVALLLVAGRTAEALWAGVTFAGIHVVTALLKEAFDRPRPEEGSAIPLPPSDSFPSGHASGAVVTFGVLALLGSERWPERRRLFWTLAIVVALAVGASRVILNVHYFTDVPAGFGLGLAWLAACLLVRDRLVEPKSTS